MKRVILVLFLLVCYFYSLNSQIPQGFNYQAIARDGATGNPITDPFNVKIAILSNDSPETVIYEELFELVAPDDHGLFNIEVGQGICQTAPTYFTDIDWSVSPKYIRTQIYYGGEWKNLGSAQLWSVPYTLVSEDTYTKQTLSISDLDLSISDGNTVSLPVGDNVWQTDGTNIFRTTGNVGVGTDSPASALDVVGDAIFRNTILPNWIEVTKNTSGDRNSGIDFHGDDTYTDFSLRIMRYNSGSNAQSRIWHRGTGALQLLTEEAAPIDFYTSGLNRLRISSTGVVGLGMTDPLYPLDVNGQITSRAKNSFRLRQTQYGAILRNDDMCFYLLLTDVDNPDGTFNSLRPLMVNLGSGLVNIGSGALTVQHGGNIGIGNTNPTGKMVIQPSETWEDDVPLFEVNNKSGIPVFAVYNNGVRILIDDTYESPKGPKGGFAIGGYDYTKAGSTVDFMRITPDSIRFNINNEEDAKGPKGGFAIGGFDHTKGVVNEDFMYITPSNSNSGKYNSFLGYRAGFNTNGTYPYGCYNNFFGHESGYSNTEGFFNTFLGYQSGYSNIDGTNNVFIGNGAGYSNDEGSMNVFIGNGAGMNNQGGNYNTAIGNSAGLNLSSGGFNLLIGYLCGGYESDLITGSYNVALGSTFFYNTTGSDNVLVGTSAGLKNNTGNKNTMLGRFAGRDNTDGSNNVYIGNEAAYGNNGSNNVIIGDNSGGFPDDYSDRLIIEGRGGWISSSSSLIFGDFLQRTLIFNGDVTVNGTFSYTGKSGQISDTRLKADILKLENVIQKIKKLNSYYFNWSNEAKENFSVNNERQIGVLAQDIETVFPELVSENKEGYKTMDYVKLTPILLQAIKEQQSQIEIMEERISQLEQMIIEVKTLNK